MDLNRQTRNPFRQRGVSLMELMIAMAISLVVSLAMVQLMANTLGTGTETIKMTRLTQEMRAAMQLITRDLRRANYHNNAVDCLANPACNPDAAKIAVVDPVSPSCFRFWYDRGGDGSIDAGAFQVVTRGGVNVVQMTADDAAVDNCGDDWGTDLDVTDPAVINVLAFTASDAENYCQVVSETDVQWVSKIRLAMQAELRDTAQAIPVNKYLEDLVAVRNHVVVPGGACP